MIDKNILILELLDECKKDIFKEIPTWIFSVINRQNEVENERDKPKKVKVIVWDLSTSEDWDIECPHCGGLLGSVEDHQKVDFCWHCGQALDWSDE